MREKYFKKIVRTGCGEIFFWTSRRRIVYLTSLGGKGRRLTVWPRHQTRTGRELFGSPSTSAACGSLPQPMWRAGAWRPTCPGVDTARRRGRGVMGGCGWPPSRTPTSGEGEGRAPVAFVVLVQSLASTPHPACWLGCCRRHSSVVCCTPSISHYSHRLLHPTIHNKMLKGQCKTD